MHRIAWCNVSGNGPNERHHRSLQGELLAIIEAAVQDGPLTPAEVLAEVRRLGLQTPGEAVALIRADRDGR